MQKNDEKSVFLTLGKFLKINDIIQSGGQAKYYLLENDILVNGIVEKRRGRKLNKGDVVLIDNLEYVVEWLKIYL